MLERKFITYILEQCKEIGIEKARVHYENRKTADLGLENGQLRQFRQADEEGIHLSGSYKGYFGSTYIEKLDKEMADAAIKNLLETAKENGRRQENSVFLESRVHIVPATLLSWEEAAENLKECYRQIKGLDERIVSVHHIDLHQTWVQISLFDENATEMTETYESFGGFVALVVQDGERKQDAHLSSFSEKAEGIDYLELGKETFQKAAGLLGAKPIQSGSYEVVLSGRAAADLFSHFVPIFKEDEAEKGDSKYAGRQGELVASSALTIYEDPSSKASPVRRTFDDEGSPTGKTFFLEKGRVGQFINCSKTAGGKPLTGNGFCKNYRSSVGSEAVAVFIEPGKRTAGEMLKEAEKAVYITGLEGFSGANAKTGDFSVIAAGLLMEHGEAVRPVNQITVGGNFYQMVKDVKEVSSDRGISDVWNSYVLAPAMWVSRLKIGGL